MSEKAVPKSGSTVLSPEARRAARQEKRQKQREQNVARAAAMHEERVKSAPQKELDFPTRTSSIHVGCSGWFYWHWRDVFYPSSLKTSDWFRHYAQTFSTVELNAPFYSWPTTKTVQSWIRQAPSDQFLYTIKVCELITHVKRLVGTQRLIQDFHYIADLLGAHCGCFLFQLPPGYTYSARRLDSLVRQITPPHRNVVEFRHRSWWTPRVFKAFEKAGIVFCSCSAPGLPEDLVQTSPEVYIRFHGCKHWYRHNYTSEELAVWSDRIGKSQCSQVWAYFNNDREGFAITNAREFERQLGKSH